MIEDDGIVEVGDTIRDNDPRMPNRKLKIIGFKQLRPYRIKAVCVSLDRLRREFTIDVTRIYTDTKPRRSGFSLVRAD